MQIDVFADVVCPWCYIGKRNLEAALARVRPEGVTLRWHAFQLNPDLPPDGVDRQRYLQEKFGSTEAVTRIHERVGEAGRRAGIEFRFDRIAKSPNTFDAHRLLSLAGSQGRQSQLAEALFHAYFIDGEDIGDRGVLAKRAVDAGMEGDIVSALAGDAAGDAVRADLKAARDMGIGGVPFCIFANRYALSGAQPVETFMQALQAAGAPEAP